MKKELAFKRRGPDLVTMEIARVLAANEWFEFKPLFLLVHASLRARGAAGGGEELLRLRAYEKLQNLVQQGIVEKTGKTYRGNGPALELLEKRAAAEQVHTQAVVAARAKSAVAKAA